MQSDELLYPLEVPTSPEFGRFKGAVHRAVCNTTGFSIADLEDVPDKQWCAYTILTPDSTGMWAGLGVIDYVVIMGPDIERMCLAVEDILVNHAAVIMSGHLPSPKKAK